MYLEMDETRTRSIGELEEEPSGPVWDDLCLMWTSGLNPMKDDHSGKVFPLTISATEPGVMIQLLVHACVFWLVWLFGDTPNSKSQDTETLPRKDHNALILSPRRRLLSL